MRLEARLSTATATPTKHVWSCYSLTTKNTTRVTMDLASMSLPWPMVDAAWPWLMATVPIWVDDGKGIWRGVTGRAWCGLLIASLRSGDAKGEEGERGERTNDAWCMCMCICMVFVSTLGVPSVVVRDARRGDAVAPIALALDMLITLTLTLSLPLPLPLSPSLLRTPWPGNGRGNGAGEA